MVPFAANPIQKSIKIWPKRQFFGFVTPGFSATQNALHTIKIQIIRLMKTPHPIFLLSLLVLTVGLAQEKLDILYLKNGNILKGVIVENEPNDHVRIELPGGSLITVRYSDIIKFSQEPTSMNETSPAQAPLSVLLNTNSIGIGIGNPYGIIGVNIDHSALSNLDLSLGLGSIIFKSTAFNIGGKYYLFSAEMAPRPRASIYYGVNNWFVKNESKANTATRVITGFGFTFAFGMQWMFGQDKKHGFDCDIYLVTPSTQPYRSQFTEAIDNDLLQRSSALASISLGYRYAF